MRLFLVLLLLGGLVLRLQAGVVKGRVTGPEGEGLPYANLYVRGTTTGTAANEEGFYQLTLKPGSYLLVFQYVGYRAQTRTVEVGEKPVELNVTLEPEAFSLSEVEVRPGKDPAYAIMQEAIRKRKYHLQEVAAYSCRVYIKGLQRLTKVPGSVVGIKVRGLKEGIAYLSESVSELRFQQPDKYHERVISSKVSGSTKTFTFNQAAGLTLNFYQNLLKAEGLHERGFVSPLAANAMLFYRYQWIGDFEDNGVRVHKIRVTPIRKNDPAFRGHIYITDDEHRLHSLQLMLTKAAQIEFIDTLHISQTYAPVSNGIWMLTTQKFTFNLDTFGFKGNGYFTAIYSNYTVKPAFAPPPPVTPPPLAAPAPTDAPAPAVAAQKPRKAARPPKPKKLPKEKDPLAMAMPKNEVLTIEEGANKRDTSYWENVRPVPLTAEEAADYHVKDSLQVIQESKPYLDSVDRKGNRLTPGDILYTGYSYRNSYRKISFNSEPLTRIWQYNTVEGVVANLRLGYVRNFDDYRRWEIRPEIRYGFSSERLYARVGGGYYFNPRKFSTVWLEGGRFVQQFNPGEPITPFMNTLYTLLAERNYLKEYEKQYVRVSHRSEITNGLRLTSNLEYADRRQLYNHTDFTLNERPTRQFTSNTPENAEIGDTSFPRHQALVAGVELRIRFGQRYLNRPDEKIILDTKWPQLSVGYRKGLHLLGSDVNFDQVSLRIDDEWQLGLLGSTDVELTGSVFLNNKSVFFPDFKHFITNQTLLARRNFDGFQLLPYYKYSTKRHYAEGHLDHHFNGFLFNKIPLFRKLKWQEVASVHYLYTPESKNYLELGVGIEHIFKVARIDFYAGYLQQERVGTGIRVGAGF